MEASRLATDPIDEPTEALCRFVAEARCAVPGPVAERAALHVLDTIGVTIAGAASPAGRIVLDYVESLGAGGAATVVGATGTTAPQHAALAHGVMGHALDYDDYTVKSLLGHPSVAVLPAALAVGEQVSASGSQVLAAYALGCEVACKLGACFNPSLFLRGWAATGVLGAFGATAAAGALLGLDAPALERAMGITASQASGVKANVGTMTKPYHAGRAAENGVVAASLAARGFDATPGILSAADGFADVFGARADHAPLARLGDPFDLVDPGFAIKRFPSCGATHAGIEAALQLRAAGLGDPGAIRSVRCTVSPHAANVLVYSRPSTGLESKFSMEHSVAVALAHGTPTAADFTDERVADPVVARLAARVELIVDDRLERQGYMANDAPVGCAVTVTTADGSAASASVASPGWEGADTPPTDELVAKFVDCARERYGPETGERIAEAVLRLADADDVRAVTGLLRGA